MSSIRTRTRSAKIFAFFLATLLAVAVLPGLRAQTPDQDVAKKLRGFDAYMAKILKDWNAPGVAVGVVQGDKLVFAKGYGYRDYGRKLPFTPTTLQQIASNTKLFTAIAAGLLVEEGKLTWDKPVKESVPSIRFYDNQLDNTVTLRDMLSHRTGITRHDTIWYQSDDTRKQLFDKLRYLEPQAPLRQTYLYNNLMYAAAGYIVELQSGKPWEEFVRERIFKPLDMAATVYSIADMTKAPEYGVPYTEKRDSFELYRIPYYEDIGGVAPCGAIISNVQDLSHWLIALMNNGRYAGRQVLPPEVLKATLEPAIALPNTAAEARGFWEALNAAYGMGRETVSYRGRLLTFHGGDLPGFHSQISFMPREKLGVIVLVIGNHCASLYNTVSYNVYERLLGLDQTPWSERLLDSRLKGKKADTEARAKSGADRVPDTRPSHALADYAGEFEHPAYGVLKIEMKDGALSMDFHKIRLPLGHFHYDRFVTPDDETYGRTSINFQTNPQGDIDKAVISLDEAEVAFTRRPAGPAPELLAKLAGAYVLPNGVTLQVVLEENGALVLNVPGQTPEPLLPYKGLQFRIKLFADVVFEFVVEDGAVKALKQRDPSGEYVFPRK
ncbi:MAG TPA: serine hydrolase [Candidatus Aminicenantes bacterium]|nr:serine hydrolase [Candidatus Aminicenantes bacterium]HRY64366.1 serine hydrolase [Candidatus Aminicenantes bacterium]HRZ71279.1 serine hydrolase [Candidatus Aminicenantes bacterium]